MRKRKRLKYKRCPMCERYKLLRYFYPDKTKRSGRGTYCISCDITRFYGWAKENPTKHYFIQKKSRLKRKYGISMEYYNALLAKQDGVCAGCRRNKVRLGVDHNHITGVVRALLCITCNRILGLVKDKKETLQNLILVLDGKYSQDIQLMNILRVGPKALLFERN